VGDRNDALEFAKKLVAKNKKDSAKQNISSRPRNRRLERRIMDCTWPHTVAIAMVALCRKSKSAASKIAKTHSH
jgi:hypothetical protein